MLTLIIIAGSTCSSSERHCADGSCIPLSSWCNQIIDCADASDEKSCSKISTREGASLFTLLADLFVYVLPNLRNALLAVLPIQTAQTAWNTTGSALAPATATRF